MRDMSQRLNKSEEVLHVPSILWYVLN